MTFKISLYIIVAVISTLAMGPYGLLVSVASALAFEAVSL